MTDKKIKEYLDRAEKILRVKLPHGEIMVGVIEIAKMIQLEEHRGVQPKMLEMNYRDPLEVYKEITDIDIQRNNLL